MFTVYKTMQMSYNTEEPIQTNISEKRKNIIRIDILSFLRDIRLYSSIYTVSRKKEATVF